MAFPYPIKLTLLSREPQWIEAAEAAGVERIGIDIESIGKRSRQAKSLQSRISDHQLSDLRTLTRLVKQAVPFVRLNSLHDGSRDEINAAIDLGARSLMLPYFRHTEDAERFVGLVAGRAEVSLLVETGAAMMRMQELTKLSGIREIMIGMNDLHWDLQLSTPFEVVVSEILSCVSDQVRNAGLCFGLGGLASHGTPGLSVSPDLILARYAQLRVGSSWLSRSFFTPDLTPANFSTALTKLRERMAYWYNATPEALNLAKAQLCEEVRHLSQR